MRAVALGTCNFGDQNILRIQEMFAPKTLGIFLVIALLPVVLIGCSLFGGKQVLRPETALIPLPEEVAVVDNGDVASFRTALAFSLEALQKLRPDSCKTYGPHRVPVQAQIESLTDLDVKVAKWGLSPTFFRYLTERFQFYRPASEEVLFTGYYEASLKGSRHRSPQYSVPLYGVPQDLVRLKPDQRLDLPDGTSTDRARRLPDGGLVPYYTRDEILFGRALTGKGLELMWLESVTDLVFLQIQGSGVVYLDSGELVRVNFAERNGWGYRAVGRYLVDEGIAAPEEVSMQSIKEFLAEHPSQTRKMLAYDPSYVFFREVERGPLGSVGVPVVPFRSLAMDRSLFPDAGLLFISLPLPNGTEVRRLAFLHDSGGAIKGPGRVDLFVGRGAEQENLAGRLRSFGSFYFLVSERAIAAGEAACGKGRNS